MTKLETASRALSSALRDFIKLTKPVAIVWGITGELHVEILHQDFMKLPGALKATVRCRRPNGILWSESLTLGGIGFGAMMTNPENQRRGGV